MSENSNQSSDNNVPCDICKKSGSKICRGHGGGGSGSDGSNESYENNANTGNTSPDVNFTMNIANNNANADLDLEITQQAQLNSVVVNPEIISELSAKQLLAIIINPELGTLSIKSTPELFHLFSDKQKLEVNKLIHTVLNEIEEFKQISRIPDKSIRVSTEKDKDAKMTALAISIPNPKYYDAFMRHLDNKKVLSELTPRTQQQNHELTKSPNEKKSLIRSPFSIDGPKPPC